MTPALIVRLALESPASVYLDCRNDGEEARLLDWLSAHEEYADLVARVLELAGRERRAA